ncbi:T9SS type A sorting domain-containing protein, partial [bacterium]|nr:T9SS type A sorting domain-containing protein [bacterium]
VTLYPCYPNPFNPSTTIAFDLPLASETSLAVFNMLGQSVYTIDFGRLNAGHHSHLFKASALPSGVYFNTLQAANVKLSNKMVLVK